MENDGAGEYPITRCWGGWTSDPSVSWSEKWAQDQSLVTAFIVRRADSGKRDIDLIAPLFDSYRQFYDEPADAELAAAFIRDRLQAKESVIFLAEESDEGTREALGFVQLYPSFSSVAACRIWVLNDLFVAPEARGRGVGRAL